MFTQHFYGKEHTSLEDTSKNDGKSIGQKRIWGKLMKFSKEGNLEERIIRNFLDILIMKYLKVHPSSSGYEILRHLYETFEITFSPGTVYHAIYWLERTRLIAGARDNSGSTYCLTENGEEILNASVELSSHIQGLVSVILSKNLAAQPRNAGVRLPRR
jgi:DNA-binding PadR family transcriptional regulator